MTGIRLTAPAPGWSIDADVVVVGSGVAGLTTALRCASAGLATVVVTKARLDDGSTRWAQGGIAAAIGEGDTPEQHLDDTLVAGAGLCDEAAVRTLVTEGPGAVNRLIGTGARFDTTEAGALALTREGGHHRRRIAHAGGDATGAEVSRALVGAVRSAALRTIENALVLDLLTDAEGRTTGVTLHVMGEGQHDGVGAVRAPRWSSPPAAWARSSPPPPTRPSPPVTGWPSRSGRAPRSPTSNSSSSIRPSCFSAPAPRASSRWSPKRYGARAPTSSTPPGPVSCSGSTSWPSWPPATSSPRPSPGRCV